MCDINRLKKLQPLIKPKNRIKYLLCLSSTPTRLSVLNFDIGDIKNRGRKKLTPPNASATKSVPLMESAILLIKYLFYYTCKTVNLSRNFTK